MSALSAGAFTTTFYVMVVTVKGGGRAPPPSPAWADFALMMDAGKVAISILCTL